MGKILMDFTPLTYSPDFRRIWLGGLFSTIGFAITSVAIALEIYALTDSAGAVGLVGLVSVVPLVIGGLYGGVIADRYDRRKVALTATLSMWGVTVLIALHAWLNIHSVAVLYALIAAESLLQPINQSARGAIIPRLIKPRLLPAANTLMMSVGTLGMSAGPLIGGLLVASVGYQLTYSINVFAMTVGIWALYRLPAMLPEQSGAARPSVLTSIREGLGFVRRNTVVGMTFVVDLLGMFFAQARPLIPALAALTGSIGQEVKGYGAFSRVPAEAMGNVRNDMYLTSEAIRLMDKDGVGRFDADTRGKLQAFKQKIDDATKFIPLWVKIAVAIALGLGTMVGWKRIVVTVGEKIGKTHLTYAQGASAETVAMLTIGAADLYGLPVSTTHVLSSGVAGTMAANGSGLQWKTIRNLLMAWVLTLPAAILLSASLYWLLTRLF